MKCPKCNSDMSKGTWGYSCPQCHSNVFLQDYMSICNKDYGFGVIETTKEPLYRQGWVCPKCGGVMSPTQPYCIFCQSNNIRDIQVTCTGVKPTIDTNNKSISEVMKDETT